MPNQKSTRLTPPGAARCRRKFLRIFPGGFHDPSYLETERDYKWQTHKRWQAALGQAEFERLLRAGSYEEIAARAVRVEQSSPYSFIFSFEKMALRDAVKSAAGARSFSEGLYQYLHGGASLGERFEAWVATVAALPRRQTRVLTWPLVTVFGFLAQPRTHLFIKPTVLRAAAAAYEYELAYESRPSWAIYQQLRGFANVVRRDLIDLRPRDMIDIQSFLWVQGSTEYE